MGVKRVAVVQGTDIRMVCEGVNDAIAEGWQPVGSVVRVTNLSWAWTVALYEEDTTHVSVTAQHHSTVSIPDTVDVEPEPEKGAGQ